MSGTLRTVRLIAWGLVAVALGVLIALAFGIGRSGDPVASATIGGPFELVNQRGEPISDRTFTGKPTAYFFGFTHCPDVCPTTLSDMTRWLEKLGAEADNLNVVFVTVDPERDTPDLLSAYLSAFDTRIVGATGTRAQVDAIIKAFRVYARKVPIEGTPDYNMDHSAAIYLMDRNGRFIVPVQYQESDDVALDKLRRALAS